MADGVQFSLTGINQLVSKLGVLTDDIKYKGGRAALRRAAQVIQAQAVANASRIDDPETAEQIAANITVRWSSRRFKRTGDLMFRIGVLGGARQYGDTKENRRKRRVGGTYKTLGDKSNPGGDTWYWRFIEFGTSPQPARVNQYRKRTKYGKGGQRMKDKRGHPGVPARPFMRPAAQQAAGDAVNEFMQQYDKALDRALRRAAKQAERTQ